jgi:DNA primase
LAEKANIDLKDYKTNFSKSEQELLQKDTLLSINKAALNFFHKQLFDSEKALDYLTNNRQLSKEQIIKFKLGFAPEKSSLLIDYLLWKWFKQEDIIKAGLGKKSASWSVYSFFTNRIIFPIFNSLGEVVAFSWRVFNWETNTWKYINTPETIVYHKSNILYNYNNAKKTKKDFLIVVEGFMDVIALDKAGFDNTVATCGTALTSNHISLLKRITPNVVFSFDSDQAWKQASLRWLKIALWLGVYPRIYTISGAKDFDELFKNNDIQIDILAESKDAVEYFFDELLSDYKSLWPVQKQEKLQESLEIVKSIWNYSIFWDYLEKLAKKINQDVNILYQQLKLKTPRKILQNTEQKDNSNVYLIPALFYNDFLNQFSINLEDYISYVLEMLDYIDDSNILKKVLMWNLDDKEKEKILEKQLWREETLSTWTKDKIENKLKQEIKSYLVKLLTDTLRSANIDDNSKLELMKILNKLRK